MENKSYLIKDTTQAERIALIKQWIPDDVVGDECDIDLWDMYDDYIKGIREIAEINASFHQGFYEESDLQDNTASCGEGGKFRGSCPI